MANDANRRAVIVRKWIALRFLTSAALLLGAAAAAAQPPLPREEVLPLPRPQSPTPSEKLPPAPEVLPPLQAAPTAPTSNAEPILLRAGDKVTLRICQMLPADHLSPGERLLNSRPPLQPGDRFLAEVIAPLPPHPVLVGGMVKHITKPGWFGRPGYLTFQMTQLVQAVEGQSGPVPWQLDLADRRLASRMRRAMITTLLGMEGIAEGASMGAQFVPGNMAFISGGMGIGLLVGLGYSSFQRGSEANLEPGDTFQIVVGSTRYRPVSREWQTVLYPAADANRGRELKK